MLFRSMSSEAENRTEMFWAGDFLAKECFDCATLTTVNHDSTVVCRACHTFLRSNVLRQLSAIMNVLLTVLKRAAVWELSPHEPEKCLPLKPVKYNKTESNNDSVTIDESVSEKCDDKCNELFDQELMEMTQSEILGMSYQYGFVLSQFTYDKNSFNLLNFCLVSPAHSLELLLSYSAPRLGGVEV